MIHVNLFVLVLISHSHVLQTVTFRSLAFLIIGTFAAGTKFCLCGFYAWPEDGSFDEDEVWWECALVDLVYDGDGVVGVGWEVTQLAPVTCFFFLFEALRKSVFSLRRMPCTVCYLSRKCLYSPHRGGRRMSKEDWQQGERETNPIISFVILIMAFIHQVQNGIHYTTRLNLQSNATSQPLMHG
jgi:hypothetical protein